MTAVAEGATQELFALESPRPGANAPQLLWHRPGRGMGDGSRWLGPVAADLDGDGGNEIIAASQDASGRALLLAYRHDGSRLWQASFGQTPGGVPVLARGMADTFALRSPKIKSGGDPFRAGATKAQA